LGYRIEPCVIRVRDRIRSPLAVLRQVGVRPSMTVLDYGCGPGGFTLAAARLVGAAGRVYAVDIAPVALAAVRRAARRHGLANVDVLALSETDRVPAGSVDLVLMYDILHIYPGPEWARTSLSVVHRWLTDAGVLSVRDHHLNGPALAQVVTAAGLFRAAGSSGRSYQFQRVGERGSGS